MNVIIVGANFGNKGAQSMLFTTVAAIRRKHSDAKIFFAHANGTPCLNENFLFEEVYFHKWTVEVSADTITITPPPEPICGLRCKRRFKLSARPI